jgi:hypothetical protein
MNTRRRASGKRVLADGAPGAPDPVQQRELALARWDNEGGAGPRRPAGELSSGEARSGTPPLKNAELVRLQVRVIALENLLIALLSDASDRQLALARDMAAYISPRPGFTPHDLTLHAAAQMIHLIERAGDFELAERLRECCSKTS